MSAPYAAPSSLVGMPAEGNPAPVQPPGHQGYTEGPTPNMAPYAPSGNPAVNSVVPQQRGGKGGQDYWRW